jgi:erythromycin esterase-like protein
MRETIEQLRQAAYVLLDGDAGDYDQLLANVGEADLVLLGAASYGTHELFHARAHITRRLIREKGFTAVALGADAASTARINSYVRGASDDTGASEALCDFHAYPNWLWRNAEMLDFVGWLRECNDHFSRNINKVGVYGLDIYNVYSSTSGVAESLLERQRAELENARRHNRVFEDDALYACQLARLSSSGHDFYEVRLADHGAWWNLHTAQLADMLDALSQHQVNHDRPDKIVVWEHLWSAGDARATEAADRGELSLGQLARQRHARATHLIGLTTFTGGVVAADEWGLPPKRRRLCAAIDGSFEVLLHAVEVPRFGLALNGLDALAEWQPERCVGFVYRPETKLVANYVRARPLAQLDQVVFFDESRSLEPLDLRGGRA